MGNGTSPFLFALSQPFWVLGGVGRIPGVAPAAQPLAIMLHASACLGIAVSVIIERPLKINTAH